MINNRPNAPTNKNGTQKYKQGLYTPINKDKVLKLNSEGGIYYRSSWEYKVYLWLDHNPKIRVWGAEVLKIPYSVEIVDENGILKKTEHTYYPDCYYEILNEDSSIKKVLMEIKPYNETIEPKIPLRATRKQLENVEYAITQYKKNLFKWNSALEYCKNRDIKFVIMTEKYVNKL
jgi:hypothetical protein